MKKICLLFALPSVIAALPQSMQIHTGSAEVHCKNNQMQIEAADRSILEWDDFSIGEQETVSFRLPAFDSAVLNRVLGTTPSQILGSLTSNGKVLLINPNGVIFGADARVDTASFLASTLNLNDRLFREGKQLAFSGSSQEGICNAGAVIAALGDLSFLSAKLENRGLLSAPNGTIHLSDAGAARSLGIANLGTIEGKRFETSSQGAAGMLVFLNQGVVKADDALVAIDQGVCAVSGAIHSPSISLFSEEIALLNGSLLDGTENPKVFHIGNGPRLAKAVLMEPEARISLDGAKAGSLYMNAEMLNAVYGKISGKGDIGSDIDISCNGQLIYEGFADLSSPLGKTGTLRFDPVDITITTGGQTLGSVASCMGTLSTGSPCSLLLPGGNCLYYPSGGVGFNINNATLSGQLGASNVILDASAPGGGAGTIAFTSGTVSWAAATTLFLIAPAGGSITVNTIVQNTGIGAAAGNVSINMLGTGTITVTPLAAATTAAIGSLNGLTNICAPQADLNILGIAASNTLAQVGGLISFIPSSATGTICVDCANLTISGGGGGATVNCVSRLGHGFLPNLLSSVGVSGNITVNCDTLTLFGGGGAAGHAVLFFGAQLGHLYPVFGGSTASANGNITVNCAGLATLTGGIDENTPAVIGHAYGNSNVAGAVASVTTQGNIRVDAGDLVLQGGAFNPAIPGVTWIAPAQIGHSNFGNTINLVASVTNSGTIVVNSASNISLTGGSDPGGLGGSHVAPAQIGHGVFGIEIDSTQLSQSIGDISVTAAGNISFRGGPTQGAYAKIGHGDNLLDGPGAGVPVNGNCTGNITITAGGTLSMIPANAPTSGTHIGHGTEQFIAPAFVTQFPLVDTGNITVTILGDITLDSTAGQAFAGNLIGHGTIASNGYSVTSLTTIGDIDVFTRGTLNLIGGTNGSFDYIGHLGANLAQAVGVFNPQIVQGNTHVEANLVSLQTFGDDVMIGTQKLVTTDIINFISGSVEVISATDISISTSAPGGSASRLASIGVDYNTTMNPIPVFAAACNDILLTNVAGGPTVQVAIQGRDNVYAAAGHNVQLRNNNAAARTFLGSYGSPGTLTQIYAGNDILSSQTTGGPFLAYFGSGWNISNTLASGSSLTIRAARDVVLSSSFPINPTPAAGNIFIEADSGFSPGGAGSSPGSLWNFSGGTLNAIANTALPAPLSASEVFACFQTNPTIPSNGNGAVSFNTAPLAAGPIFSAAGSVTVNSADTNGSGAIANLILTSAPASSPNQLNIATAGSICISGFGSGCGPRVADFCQGDNIYGTDSFNNININQALAPTLPGGGIYISANNDLTDNSTVTTTAGSIVLISDNDRTGAGDLLLNSVVTSGSGLIFLQAGVYGTGSSSIIENNPAQILSSSGNIVLSAASNINLLSAAAPAISTGGFIHMIADDTINFGSALISTSITGGSIFAISGVDININNASTLASPGTVRLVVDNNNCCPNTLPTCGISSTPGIVNMAAAASIAGGAIQIYTANQGTSILDGQLNGVAYGFGAFTPGTPFVDTFYEQWCSCCSCLSCTAIRTGNSNPFTIFYKPCLQLILLQATEVIDEFLVDLHPYNEFPGWMERFLLQYSDLSGQPSEPYYFRRRHLNVMNHPKSWTAIFY